MGNQPTRYAVLLAAAGLCASALLTGCDGGEKPSPPPTGGGSVAAGPTSDSPTGTPTGPTSTADPTTPGASDPTSTSQPSETSSPTKSGKGAPGVPEAARQHTKKGAEAFVRYYSRQIDRAWSLPRAGLLTPLSLPKCKTCAGYEKQASQGVRTGHRVDGPSTRTVSVEITNSPKMQGELATVHSEILKQNILDGDGNVIGQTKPSTFFTEWQLRWTDNGWRVKEIQALKQS